MMTETTFMSDLAIPPGEYLEEVLEETAVSQAELARRMGRPPQAINEIVKGDKAITPETALQLEQVLGVSAQFWNNLEAEYRLIKAREQLVEDAKKEESLVVNFPYAELCKLDLVAKATKAIDKVSELRRFFAVSSLFNIKDVKEYGPAFRQVEKKTLSHESLAAWLRAGHFLADEIETQTFDKSKLLELIPELRALTKELEPNTLIKKVRLALVSCGVALVVIPHFSKTYTTGATFWIGKSKPVIMMSLRGGWSDIFWFSLFHEIAHILLHDKRITFLESGSADPQYVKQEMEADYFAQTSLIPKEEYEAFINSYDFSAKSIEEFSDDIGIYPGIVTGRLQHDKKLPHTIHHHRVRYKWS